MSNNFKEGFERYREAINNDIKDVEIVVAWLEQYRANSESYLVYLGYTFDESEHKYYEQILIGKSTYTLQELFDNYEWQDGSNIYIWKPFGSKD